MRERDLACCFLILVIVLLCMATNTAVATGPPGWVSELVFKDDVIETVGFSSEMPLPEISLEMADNWARGEMVKTLAAVVKASIRTSFRADESLDAGRVDVFYKKVVELYAQKTVEGLAIVDHYIDPETGITYALARLSRKDAMKDASMKAKLTVSGSKSTFDERSIQAAIKSRLAPVKPERLAATGRASVLDADPREKSINYEKAMKMAETNARVALAQQVRVTITSSVKEWVEAHESNLRGDSSTEIFYEAITKSFTDVKLDGARIMKRYFSEDTGMAYAQAVMDWQWIADEFSQAVAPVIEKNVSPESKAEVEKQIDNLIHKNLRVLMEKSAPEDAPETQSQIETSQQQQYGTVEPSDQATRFRDWGWWRQSQIQGVHDGCFYGIGNGSSEEAADKRALNNLAKYMGVTIRSRVESILKATQKDIDTSYCEYVDIITNQDFYGVTHLRYFQEPTGKWYSLAYVPPAPLSITICIDEHTNGKPSANAQIRNLLKADITGRGHTVKYLSPRYTEASSALENSAHQNVDASVTYTEHLSSLMIIGKASVTVRPTDAGSDYGEQTKDWKTAEAHVELDVIDTRSLNVILSLEAQERGTHKQEAKAVKQALNNSYDKVSVELLKRLEQMKLVGSF